MRLSCQRAAESALIVLAPIAGFFALHICLIQQRAGDVDPWFYTGYGQEFKLFQAYFGWPYYAVRFPVILLNLSVSRIHDPVVGFAILRYVLFLSCGVPLYFWARRHFGTVYAVAAYLFLICNPLFPCLLLWDLTPFVSIPMALAGMTLWQLPAKPNAINRAASGFAFCASAAAHAFTGTAIAIFFLVEATRRLIKREYSDLILLDILVPILGATACFAIGVTCYFVILGPFDPTIIFRSTLNAITAGDQFAEAHNRSVATWIWGNTNVLVPFTLVGFIAIGFARELLKDTCVARVWWFGFLYCGAYAIYQFIFHRFVLETYFYFFHLTLVVYMIFPACLYLITRKLAAQSRVIVVLIAVSVLIALPIFKTYFVVDPATLKQTFIKCEALWILVICLIIVGVWAIRFVQKTHIGAAVYVVALILIVQFQALSAWPFGAVYSNPDKAKNYDLYRAAVQMVRLFGRYATPVHRVMLWYSGKDLAAWSIASTVLVYDVNKPYQLEGGLPDIGHYEMSRLNSPDLRYVMMISTNPELIKNGKNALVYHGYEHRDIEERTIGGANFETNLDLVEIIPAAREKAMAQARSVPLASMKVAGPSASLQPTIAGIEFRSAPIMWSYIGQMPLRAACIDGGGWVAVDIGVSQGLIGVGVLNRKGNGFLARVPVLRSDKSQTVFLRLDSFAAAGEFLVQNWNVNSSSQGIIHAVRLAAENGVTPHACVSGEISRP